MQMPESVRIRVADPVGNITIFVLDHFGREDYAELAKKLLAVGEIGAEQVAFVTGKDSMDMCGLEFCGNATRAFALMKSKAMHVSGSDEAACDEAVTVTVKTSGVDKPVDVEVWPATDYTKIGMPPHRSISRPDYADGKLVVMDGIVHLVLEDAEASDEVFEKYRRRIAEELDPPAIGVMFCSGDKLTPVVYVKEVDTVYHEGSCCSGTTAVMIARASGQPDGFYKSEIIQPSGVLTASAEVRGGKIVGTWIEGPVRLHEAQTIQL